MYVHTGAVITEHGLGHKGNCFAMLASCVLRDVFVKHDVVCGPEQRIETDIDLRLSSGANLMMLGLDRYAQLFEQQCHLATNVLKCVIGCDREVAFLHAHAVTKIGGAITRAVPMRFIRVDFRVLDICRGIVAHVVEDIKF